MSFSHRNSQRSHNENSHSRHHHRSAHGTQHRPQQLASSTTQASSAVQYPPDIEQGLKAVQEFTAARMSKKCHSCSSPLTVGFSAKNWIRRWSQGAEKNPKKATYLCAAACPKCEASTCLGCGREPRKNKQPQSVDGYYIDWCCREGRMLGMWAFLARFDQVELEIQASASMSGNSRTHGSIFRAGSTQDSRGVGYADSEQYNPWTNMFYDGPGGPAALSRPLEFRGSDSKTDRFLTILLCAVKEMVPSRANKNLPPALRGMFQLSIIIDKLAELLRNDSLEDITSRTEVYMAAFGFLKKLGGHPELISLVQTPRYHKQSTPGLEALTLNASNGNIRRLVLGEKIPSVAESLQKLVKQSEIVLGTKESQKLTSSAGKEMLDICEEIAEVYAILAPGQIECKKDAKSIDKYAEYHQEKCVTRDEGILRNHAYSAHIALMTYSPRGRMKRLLAELANMATSLPVGIYVKVSESRPDVMRCLVMGPPDSPYGYGLFDFDLLCRETYPQQAPVMTCRTALELRESLNPNLHPDGKVCLSLLGTWREGDAAAQWQPGKSTVLSVLISIQAMIFTEDPIMNEPAFTGSVDDDVREESRGFIRKVQLLTIQYGMLSWLESSQKLNGVWGDIVKAHFRLNKDKILANVEKWKRGNLLISRGGLFRMGASLDDRLRSALNKLARR